jgi:nicotinate-nucleotide adenylyltransferase
MRAGLFGGTFNPVHTGHLRAAEECAEIFSLDRVYLIPSYTPPHKPGPDLAGHADRLAMVRLAVEDNPRFLASGAECARGGPSYTRDTLLHFRNTLGPSATLFFIAGADAVMDIHTWRAYPEIFQLAHVLVLSRPGQPGCPEIFSHIAAILPKIYTPSAADTLEGKDSFRTIHFFPCTALDISASLVRRLAREKRSLRYLVVPKVADYICEKGLYT